MTKHPVFAHLGIHRRYWRGLRTHSFVLLPLLAIALLLLALPPAAQQLSDSHFLTLHTALELFAVVVALLIFATGWRGHWRGAPLSSLVVAVTFLVVGLLDLSHALSFQGLPFFGELATPDTTVYFWLAARTVATVGLLLAVLLTPGRVSRPGFAYWLLPASLLLVALLHWLILTPGLQRPVLYDQVLGLSAGKVGMEYLLVLLNLLAAALVLRRMREPPVDSDLTALFAALVILALSGPFFAHYASMTDLYMIAGHAYKAVAYVLLYRGIFLEVVDLPYRRLQSSERRLQQLLAQQRLAAVAFETQVAIMVTDADQRILRVNRTFSEITGYSSEEVIGRNPRLLSSGLQSKDFYREMWAQLLHHGRWEGEIWNRRKNGEVYPERLVISVVRDQNGEVEYYVANFGDLTRVKEAEERIHALAYYDPLTRLANRRMLADHVRKAQSVARETRSYWALLFIDLDRFKSLNDVHGHAVGDQLLQRAAERLLACTRSDDVVSRPGGDEFVLLLQGLGVDHDQAASTAGEVANKVISQLGVPYFIDNHSHQLGCSVGIALCLNEAEESGQPLARAEQAMYQAKEAGGSCWRFFDPATQAAAVLRNQLTDALRGAVDEGGFRLYYQPKVDIEARIVGFEALIRWPRADGSMVPPAEFIPLAEATGLILPLGRWVIDQACQQLVIWAADPQRATWSIAVNISERQLSHADFLGEVKSLLREHALEGQLRGRLMFEITESMLLQDMQASVSRITELAALGIEIAMDDFGTGYSSLSYLKMLPLHQVKVDQSFVRDMLEDHADAVIVEMVIALSRTLRLSVVAEGVETLAQHQALVALGCDYLQGYLYGHPTPVEQIPTHIQLPGSS